MGKAQQRSSQQKYTINASEINEYVFCHNAWYLRRCGYEPQSLLLEPGKQMHIEYGNTLEQVHHDLARFRRIITYGIMTIVVACIVLFYGMNL